MASKLIIPIYVNRVGKMLKRSGFSEYYSTSYKVQLKRGTNYRFHVYFVEDSNNSTTYLLDAGAIVRISIREENVFDESTGVLASADSTADPSNFNNPYVIDLNLNTEEIDDYLGVDADAGVNDVASATVEFGISWTEDAWVTKQENTDRVQGTLINDVNKINDLTPTVLPSAETWLTARAIRYDLVQSLTLMQQQQAQSNIGLPKANYTATTNPTALDDNLAGYSAGSLWLNTTSNEAFRCVDAGSGAAVWIETTYDSVEVAAVLLAGAPPANVGAVTGSTTLDRANGAVQYCYLTGNTTLNAPSNGAAGKELTLYVQYTTGAHTLNFDAAITMDAAVSALLPITLDTEKAYAIKFAHFGGSWVLLDIQGPFAQTLYP